MLFVQGTTALFAQQPALRLATTATVQPRWTALASHNVYLLATTATQARGQNVMGIFAATNKGLFQSLDTGQTWGSLGLPNDDVYDAVFLGSAVIAATDKGIQTRASASAAWQSRTYPVVNQNSTQATVQQRGLPTYTLHTLGANIYAGTTRGVYRSQDGGATWTTTGTALAGKTVRNLVALGTTLFAAVWNDGVYRSQDNGATWTLVDVVPGSTVEKTFRTLAVYGTTVYAGSAEGNVYQSANGITWTKVVSAGNNGQSGLNARGVEALARYGTTIVGAAYNGVAVSHNNGQTWSLMPVATQNINTIVILPPRSPAKRSSTTTLAAGKQGASLTLVTCDGNDGQNCGGGGVAVGSGGTSSGGSGTGGVSGYNFVGCNPFSPNITFTPSPVVQQSSALAVTFSIGASAIPTEFAVQMASPSAPSIWIDVTNTYQASVHPTTGITGSAIIPATFMQTPGTYQIRAWGTNENGVCGATFYTSEPRSFVISSAAPVLSTVTVSPAGAYTGQASSLTFSGSNFFAQPNVSIAFFNASAQPVSIATTPTSFSPTALSVNFIAPQSGLYYAEVRNTINGTTYSSGRVSFTIAVPPAPMLSSVTLPNSALRLVAGASGSITLGGSNFSTNALDGSAGGATVQVNGQNGAWAVASRTASALTVQLPASLAAGTYTLRVVNADGQVSSASQDVIVVPPLAVSASTPETLIVEEASTVTMTGTFRSAATLVDAPNRTGTTTIGNTAISFGVTIPGANAPTSYSITLSEPTTFGQNPLVRTIPVRFPLPALTGITPNELDASTPENGVSTTITLAGTGFTTRTSLFAGTRDLSAFISARSQTSLTLTFPSGTFLTPEVLQLRAENPGAQVSGTQTLTVKNIAPVFTSVAPQTLVAGEGGNITITGSKFFTASVTQVFVGDDASAVQLSGANVTPTSITVSVPAARVPDIGTLRLRVRNVFGTDVQLSEAQTVRIVHAQPTISAIAPALIPAFENSTTLTITGTKFAVGQSTMPVVPARLRVTWVKNNVETALTLLPNPTATELRVSVPAALLAELGTASVRVQNTDAAESNGGPSANSTVTVVPPRPTLSSVAPASVLAGNVPVMLTVSGAKFIASGIRIVLRNTQTGVSRNLTATTFLSNTSLSGFIPSDMQLTAGNYTLEVVNAPDAQGLGGGISTTTLPLTILNPPPSITTLTPAPNPATVFSPFTLEINGSGFIAGATAVEVDGQMFAPASVTVLSPTRLTVSVAAIAVAKNASVRVTNPKTMVGTAEQGGGTATTTLPVVPPIPVLQLAQGNQAGGTLTRNQAGTLTITGSGFVAGATVLLNGQALTTTLVSQTALTAVVPASMLPTHGAIGVAVRNPQFASLGGGTSTPEIAVTVQNPTAVLNNISPNAVTRGFAANITLNGSSFYDGAVVSLNNANGAVVATFATTFVSSNALSISLSAASLPVAGVYTLAVRNSDPTPAFSTARSFTVNNPAAVLGSLSLTEAEAYSTDITLTASGSGFEQGLQAYWTPQGGSRQALPAPTGVSANACTITIPAALLLRAGAFSISLENAAPSLGVSNNLSFTVFDRVPTVSAALPNPIEALSGNTQITITGDYFAPTAEALWDGVPLTRVGTASRTSLVATVPASRLLVATIAAISVRNPQFNGRGGGTSNPAQDLVVTNPLPALTNLTPDFVNAGVSRASITLDGTKFMAVSVVEIGDDMVWQAVTTAYVSPTRLSIVLSSAALVQPAVLMLRVSSPKTNNQGGGMSSELPFIIRPADPVLSRLSPTSATLTATTPTVEITLIGTGFTPASVVRVAGVPTTGVQYLSPTQLRITLARPAGVVGLSVVNAPVVLNGLPQGGGTSGTVNFSVLHPQPVLTMLTPSLTSASLTRWTLRLAGSNFTPQSRVNYGGTLVPVGDVVVRNATEILAEVDSPPLQATTINVRVENPLVAAQGGGVSAWMPLTIEFPRPVITALSDYSTTASYAAWTMTITGKPFAPAATLTLNGQPITPTSITPTQVKVQIPAAAAQNVGYYTLAITNPAPGGGTAEATFTVNNPAPTLVSITPTTTTASNLGSLTFTLTGTQFTTTASVVLDGGMMNPVSYTMSTGVVFVSPTVLRLTIPQSRITTSGNYTLRVANPLPGGGQTGTRTFAVTPALPSVAEFVGVTTAVLAGSADAFTVNFRDVFGNLAAFPASVVNFTNESGSVAGTIPLAATTNPAIFTAPRTPYTIDGNYRLWIGGISTTTGNASFVVNANNDARVEFSGVTNRLQAGGTLPSFTVKYFDTFNNPTDRNVGAVTLRFAAGWAIQHTLPVVRVSEGVYTTLPYTLTVADTYFVQVSGITQAKSGYVSSTGTVVVGALPSFDVTPTAAVRATLTGVDIDINAAQTQSAAKVRTYDQYGNLTNVPTITTLTFSNATDATVGIRSSTGTLSLTRTGFGLYDVDATKFWFAGNYTLASAEMAQTTGNRTFAVRALVATNVAFQPSTTTIAKGDENAFLTITYRDKFGNATNLATFPADVEYAGMTMSSNGTLSLGVVPTLPGTVRTKLSSLSKLGDYRVQIAGLTLPVVGTQRFEVIGREAASAEISGLPASLGCNSTDDIDIALNIRDAWQEPTNNYPSGIRFVVTRNGIEIERGTLSFIRELSEGTLLYRLRAPFTPGIYTLSVISTSLAPEDVTGNLVMDVCPNLVPSIVLSPTSLFFTAISLSGSVVQTYTVQYQNTNSVTITLPPGFFVRVQNFGTYQSGTVTLPTPGASGTLTLQLLYEPTALGVVNVNIPHSGVGTSLTTPTRNLNVVASVVACPVVRDTVSILPVFSQTARQNLIDDGRNISRYLTDTYRISNPVFRNSGINNVMIRFTHPEGVLVGNNDLFMSNAQVVNARTQARADVVAFYNHNGDYYAQYIGSGRDFDFSYFYVDSRGNPLTYITMHEVGHVLYGAHEFGASTGFDQNDLYPDGRGITQWVHRISPTGVWSRYDHGTMLFHGRGVTATPPISERVPFFSNPNISIEVRADADPTGTIVQMNGRRTLVMGDAATANMARVIALEGPIVANQFPTLLSIAILGSPVLARGANGQYTVQTCSNRDLRYEWSIRPVETIPGTQFQLVGTDAAFNLTMLPEWDGLILRVRVFDVVSGVELGSDEIFIQCGFCDDALVALQRAPQNGASLSAVNTEAAAGQAPKSGEEAPLIQGLVLEPNYPNPFSQETEIAFTLPATTHVRLLLYDALGREVAMLLNGETYSRGRHTLKFNGTKLPSGVYSLHLQAGIWKTSRTITLIR